MKRFEVNEATLSSLLNGARLMVVKMPHKILKIEDDRAEFKSGEWTHNQPLSEYREQFLPFKQGDEIYIAYNSIISGIGVDLKPYSYEVEASEMTYEQSRLRFTVGEVVVKRVSEMKIKEVRQVFPIHQILDIDSYEHQWLDWLKAQDIEPTDYVALVEVIKER